MREGWREWEREDVLKAETVVEEKKTEKKNKTEEEKGNRVSHQQLTETILMLRLWLRNNSRCEERNSWQEWIFVFVAVAHSSLVWGHFIWMEMVLEAGDVWLQTTTWCPGTLAVLRCTAAEHYQCLHVVWWLFMIKTRLFHISEICVWYSETMVRLLLLLC